MSREGQALPSHLSDFMMGYLGFIDGFSEAGFETSESVNEDSRVYSRGKCFLYRT